jgi:Zn-dependent peptidase ImmA (M78 family)
VALSRIDLDGKGSGSPDGLVRMILKAEPGLSIPVPIERLCRSLDIEDIQDLNTEGFEGGLITDPERSRGVILARKSHPYRRRFTLGHELAHFLIPAHMPNTLGRFLCSREDMRRLSAAENDRRGRMEVEANRFAALILMPPPLLRPRLKSRRDPDVGHMAQLAADFKVSKQAMANAYAQYQGEILAFVFTKGGKVLFPYKHLNFPFLTVRSGQAVPDGSLLKRRGARADIASDVCECVPDIWIDIERGKPAPQLYEQVLGQRDDFAIVMLWLEPPEDNKEDEDLESEMTAKERFRARGAIFAEPQIDRIGAHPRARCPRASQFLGRF